MVACIVYDMNNRNRGHLDSSRPFLDTLGQSSEGLRGLMRGGPGCDSVGDQQVWMGHAR